MPTELYCARCRGRVHEGDTECPACHASLAETDAVSIKKTDVLKDAFKEDVKKDEQKSHAYAGFWLRLIAWLIDQFIFFLAGLAIRAISMLQFNSGADMSFWNISSMSDFWSLYVIGFMIGWFYYAILESMPTQGTIGKIVMKLRVTNMKEEPVTFARASARYFARYITTATIGIGYIIIAFTKKKQALHDMISGCLVMKK
jgi:uncharacterized RDD family membrane protein YckC